MKHHLRSFGVILLLFCIVAPSLFAAAQQPESGATAFVVNAGGFLLTSAHAVDGQGKVEVTVGGKAYPATVVGMDRKSDMALLHIEAQGLLALPLADSNAVEVGEEVRAFGFPLSVVLGESVKVTHGTISGIEVMEGQKCFQIDADVYPGNSGGPLVNGRGEVVGIVCAQLTDEAGYSIGFAVPINYAQPLLASGGVGFATKGAETALDGPALVRRVTPAIARLRFTPGGAPASYHERP